MRALELCGVTERAADDPRRRRPRSAIRPARARAPAPAASGARVPRQRPRARRRRRRARRRSPDVRASTPRSSRRTSSSSSVRPRPFCTAARGRSSLAATPPLFAPRPRADHSSKQREARAGACASTSRRAREQKVALIGVSLVLDLPRFTGAFSGYPHDVFAGDRVAHSPLRPVFSHLPAFLRRDILARRGRRLAATAAFAGRPSVAHAEALVRGVELRGARIDEPLDTLVVGAPWVGPHVPREPVNPVTAAAVAFGLALRLHRGDLPVRPGGTVILCHPLRRAFAPRQPGAVRGDVQRTSRGARFSRAHRR